MPTPQVRVELGLDSQPDDPSQTWTDISADVRLLEGVTMNRGRADEFAGVEPGRLALVLDNASGDYTYGSGNPTLLPGKRIRVLASADSGDTWWPRFDGYVDGWPVSWAQGVTEQPRVSVGATDRLARFGLNRVLRDAVLEEVGPASTEGAFWFVGDDPDYPDGALYPDAALFPASELFTAGL